MVKTCIKCMLYAESLHHFFFSFLRDLKNTKPNQKKCYTSITLNDNILEVNPYNKQTKPTATKARNPTPLNTVTCKVQRIQRWYLYETTDLLHHSVLHYSWVRCAQYGQKVKVETGSPSALQCQDLSSSHLFYSHCEQYH